jgi:hypothetical protein
MVFLALFITYWDSSTKEVFSSKKQLRPEDACPRDLWVTGVPRRPLMTVITVK